jgi:hypothetical protein
LLQNTPTSSNRRGYSFRFENCWLKEDDIMEVVEEGWGRGRGADVINKTNRCADTLSRWGRRKRMRFK